MFAAAAGHLLIDASVLSGGGQAVRNAVALSALMSKPVSFVNLRKRRKNSGLTHQIIADTNLVRDICSATTTDCRLRSFRMDFAPQSIRTPGRYLCDSGSVTSTSLNLQAALPCLTFSQSSDSSSKLFLIGRTNGRRAPHVDYTEHVLFPFLRRRFGLDHKLDIVRRGYQDQGGGIVNVDVGRTHGPLPAVDLLKRGAVTSIKGRAYVCGDDAQLANRIRSAATSALIMSDINPEIIDITSAFERIPAGSPAEKASGLVLWAETENGCILGSSSVGLQVANPRVIGRDAARTLLRNLRHEGCVDEYLQRRVYQDQMIVFLALAGGRSRIRTGPLTDHTRTAMWIAEQLSGAKFTVTADSLSTTSLTISCEGIGYTA
ncbi:RNA 3'-terminal phosphate cyclase domain-containing protein [Cytidiella melzeri]|nr:RNA 3'-terminal phosphate cyclase domain-containing protein [Cytidiella melzeri]